MFFRKGKNEQPIPPWMKWAVVAFLGLAFLGSAHNRNLANGPKPIPEALSTAATNLSPKKLFPVDEYKNAISPITTKKPQPKDAEMPQSIKDVTTGEGTPAVCGQQVTIAYKAYGKDDKLMDGGQTLVFRIGEGKVNPVLEQGIIGMKKDGKRTILSSSQHFEAELLDTSPSIPDFAATPYRITSITPGNGMPILCGKSGKFQVTLWGVDGKKLFSTKDSDKPITFTPGKSEVFLGLEQGVIGIRPGETRTLLVPPDLQKTMKDNPSAVDFPLPKDQTVLVDVEAMP